MGDGFGGLPIESVLRKPYSTDAMLRTIRDALADGAREQND
jgi:hypothetical protein